MTEAPPSTGTFTAALQAVRRTHDAHRRTQDAHATAIDALERAFDAGLAELADGRRALQDDRAAFVRDAEDKVARDDAEKARARAAAPPPDDVVKLNVGGARFEASRAALTRVEDSMLGRMFGRSDAALQPVLEDGSIFIDRDGERFGMILDFLRDAPPDGRRMQRVINALPSNTAQEAMLQELDYFGLKAAVYRARLFLVEATFTKGPLMLLARSGVAGVSAGGRVVVFGGQVASRASKYTEVFDARTMEFKTAPAMLKGRDGCAAVQIDADRVLVVGGTGTGRPKGTDPQVLRTTEILRLSTLTFTPGPKMQTPRQGCAAVALDARRFLVVGGENDGSAAYSTTEILDLDSMSFSPGPTMAAERGRCAAVAFCEDRILVVGGYSYHGGVAYGSRYDSGNLSTTEILDVRAMSFSAGPPLRSARCNSAVVQVDSQHVLVIGGMDVDFEHVATTEMLDMVNMESSPGPTMGTPRTACAAARIDAAGEPPRILVVGGHAPDYTKPDSSSGSDDDRDPDLPDEVFDLASTEVLAVGVQGARHTRRPQGVQ